MKFQRNLKPALTLDTITWASLLNFPLLFFSFLFAVLYVTFPVTMNAYLPKTLTSDIIPQGVITILITSEDVIYFHNQVMTENELFRTLQQAEYKNLPVLIKADRRSSIERLVDIWEICRRLNLEHVNIAAIQPDTQRIKSSGHPSR